MEGNYVLAGYSGGKGYRLGTAGPSKTGHLAQILPTPTLGLASGAGPLLPSLPFPARVWDGIHDLGGFHLLSLGSGREGAETPGAGAGVIGFRSMLETRKSLGRPRARPPGGVALLAPGAPGWGDPGPGAQQGGAPRDLAGLPNRPSRSSQSRRLSDLNRGGRAAGLRFPTAIGCGGAVTSARGLRGGEGAGGAWKGSVRAAPCPESWSPRKQTPARTWAASPAASRSPPRGQRSRAGSALASLGTQVGDGYPPLAVTATGAGRAGLGDLEPC